MEDDFVDFPELPDEVGETKTSNECDIDLDLYTFFNKLQSPWQQLFIDIRDSDEFKQWHPRFTINIPINISEDLIFNTLKNDIETQQNMVKNMYIYTNIYNSETKDHCSGIIRILKEKFMLYPQMFIFNDKNGFIAQKYPFLCEYELDDKKKQKDDEKHNKKKAFAPKYPQRFRHHLEYPNQILNDTLFLGDYGAAVDKTILKHLGISHIVNCTRVKNKFEKDKEVNIKYFQIPINDGDNELIALYFEKGIEFIDNAIKDNTSNRVLIHCAAGISRSGAMAIAYLMRTNSMTMDDAVSYVRERRSCVDPNGGFRFQLQYFEKHKYKIDEKTLKQELHEFDEELYINQ